MAKFYVQSGPMRMLVQADDLRKAALWAVHQSMQHVLPLYEDRGLSCEEKHNYAVAHGCVRLGPRIGLSESGFETAVTWLDTLDVLTEWSQLLVALARLEARLSRENAWEATDGDSELSVEGRDESVKISAS